MTVTGGGPPATGAARAGDHRGPTRGTPGAIPAAGPAAPRRILFVAEAVTLAQVVRLATLARSLDPRRHEVHFASASFDPLVFAGTAFQRHPIHSLSPRTVEARVAGGRRLYGKRTLRGYVREERALLAALRPSVVVGDLRLSLPISAALERVPHISLINAYWSPHVAREGFPLPDHPIVRLLGVPLAERHFARALPFVFRHFARPVNALRAAHGLPPLGSLPEVLTAGDRTVFPDVPALVPTRALPAGQVYLGPVLWSPPIAPPPWWDALDEGRPTIYVTLGSSGRVGCLRVVVEAAASLGLQLIVATAGRAAPLPDPLPAHVHVADYVPGHLAARRSRVVVSNGGSTTGYQALAEGRPVLGVAFNLDQYLAMAAIEGAGAGLTVRGGALTAAQARHALVRLLSEPGFERAATKVAHELGRWNSARRFAAVIDELDAAGPA